MVRWSHRIVTPSSIEVISLADAKDELDITFDDDDDIVTRNLAAAIQFIEAYTSSFLAPTVVEMSVDGFPSGTIPIPFGPVLAGGVASVQYLSSNAYVPFASFTMVSGEMAAIAPSPGYYWPHVGWRPDAVKVQFTAGYPEGECPDALKQAVMVALRAYYEAPDASSLEAQLDAARTVAAPYKLSFL